MIIQIIKEFCCKDPIDTYIFKNGNDLMIHQTCLHCGYWIDEKVSKQAVIHYCEKHNLNPVKFISELDQLGKA